MKTADFFFLMIAFYKGMSQYIDQDKILTMEDDKMV